MKDNKKVIIAIISVILLLGIAIGLIILTKDDDMITITFDSNGGSIVSSIKIKKGESITLPETKKEDYQFLGWYDEEKLITNQMTFNEDTILKAKWNDGKDTFTVYFDSDGGSIVEDLVVTCGDTLVLPERPIKEGYRFVSWVDRHGRSILDEALLSCEDIHLTATWEKK